MYLKVILGLMFPPYGIYLILKNKTGKKPIFDSVGGFYEKSNNLYTNTDYYQNYFEINLNTDITEIKQNLPKGVVIPIHKLFQTSSKNSSERSNLHKIVDIGVNHSLNKSLTSDLIVNENGVVIKTNTLHPLGKMRKTLDGIDEIELLYKDISSVQFKSGDNVLPGTMTFIFPGKQNYPNTQQSGWDVNKKGQDPYVIYFPMELNNLMTLVKNLINSLR